MYGNFNSKGYDYLIFVYPQHILTINKLNHILLSIHIDRIHMNKQYMITRKRKIV